MNKIDQLATDFAKLYLRTHRLLDRRMAAQGASLARTKLLIRLSDHDTLRATDLAEWFQLAPRTVTEALDGLERDGLVARTPDPRDRRVKRVSITEEGRRAIAASEPMRSGLVTRIFGTLNPDEIAQLERLVVKLTDAVTRAEAED